MTKLDKAALLPRVREIAWSAGAEILKRLKGNSNLKRVPVVILTTTDDESEIERCYDLGCNVYITKPVDYDSFAHAIRQLGLFFSVIPVPENG